MLDFEKMAADVVKAAQGFVARAVADLGKRIDGIETQVKAIPAGKDGAPGERGPVGERGEKGMDGAAGEPGARGDIGPQGPAGEKGIDGTPGANGERGEKGDPGDVGLQGEPGPQGPAGPAGNNGTDGAKGIDGTNGADGKSMTPADVEALLDPLVNKWALDFERRAQDLFAKAAERIPAPKDGADGFNLDDLTIEDDGHGLVTLRFLRGALTKSHTLQIPWPEAKGVYRADEDYRRGNGVTWGGAWYFALKDAPQGKPGESDDWLLSVKKGEKGADVYQVARRNGFTGTEPEWLQSLRGDAAPVQTVVRIK